MFFLDTHVIKNKIKPQKKPSIQYQYVFDVIKPILFKLEGWPGSLECKERV
jgi:hypothetical protein